MIISGSFLLSIIHNEFYEDQDIDIYTKEEFLMRNGREVESAFEDFLVKHYKAILKVESYSGLDSRSHKYLIPNGFHGFEINIINVGNKDLKEHIRNISDLDFCTCIYDGHQLEFPISALTKIGREINNNILFDNTDEYIRYKFKRQLRISKYLNRGFSIETSFILDDNFRKNEQLYHRNKFQKDKIISDMLSYINHTLKNKKLRLIYPEMPLTQVILTSPESIIFST